ncbi:MAG TPA: hypothetical protein GXZ60_04330 [Intrasporangiaceae bacterium]|nr:hypothetical protein [Intrasporangiaceae bacterium]
MPDSPADHQPAERSGRVSANKVILVLVAIIVLLLLGLLAAAVVPRWWAQRVGTMVDGRLMVGGALGIVFGMVFTAAPIVFFGVAGRHLRSIGKALTALVVGLLLATPNLVTLAIVLGTGNAAHAGQRILDVDGPGFRGGTAVGAVIGAVLAIWIVYLMWSRRRRGRRLAELSAAEKAREEQARADERGADGRDAR